MGSGIWFHRRWVGLAVVAAASTWTSLPSPATSLLPVWSQDFGESAPVHALTHDAALRETGGLLAWRMPGESALHVVSLTGTTATSSVTPLPVPPARLVGGAPGSHALRSDATGRVQARFVDLVSADSRSIVPATLEVRRFDGTALYTVAGLNDHVFLSSDGSRGAAAPSLLATPPIDATPAQVSATASVLFFDSTGITASWHDPDGLYELGDMGTRAQVLAYPSLVAGSRVLHVVSRGGALLRTIACPGENIVHVGLSPNETKLAFWRTTRGGELCVASVAGSDLTCSIHEPLRQLTWSNDGSRLLARGDSSLRFHDAATLQALWTLSHSAIPAGMMLVAADASGKDGILALFARAPGSSVTPPARLAWFNALSATPIAVLDLPTDGGEAALMDQTHEVSLSDDGVFVFVRAGAFLALAKVQP